MNEENNGAGSNIATKSKWKSPDKFFPIVVDNFFDDPEALVEYGKSLPKEVVGNQPGLRTKHFWELNVQLHNAILRKILSCYYDLDYTNIAWKLSNMSFHEIPRFSENKDNLKNKGWIHQDNGFYSDANEDDLAGLIYLTPDIDPDSGTSLWSLKPDAKIIINAEEEGSAPGQGEEYVKQYLKQRENLVEKFRFQNFFNRMIMYDTNEFHGANSYWNDDGKDPRLTLLFFIGGIRSSSNYPLKRIKSSEFENVINERTAI